MQTKNRILLIASVVIYNMSFIIVAAHTKIDRDKELLLLRRIHMKVVPDDHQRYFEKIDLSMKGSTVLFPDFGDVKSFEKYYFPRETFLTRHGNIVQVTSGNFVRCPCVPFIDSDMHEENLKTFIYIGLGNIVIVALASGNFFGKRSV